jgi:hypothetical protein
MYKYFKRPIILTQKLTLKQLFQSMDRLTIISHLLKEHS